MSVKRRWLVRSAGVLACGTTALVIASVAAVGEAATHPSPALSVGSTQPRWSPDGKKLAFNGDGIYVVNADGSGLRRIASARGRDYGPPSWSPDGEQIAFATNTPLPCRCGPLEIRVIKSAGSDEHLIYHRSEIVNSDGWTTWAPDGRHIAFVCNGPLKPRRRTHVGALPDTTGRKQPTRIDMPTPYTGEARLDFGGSTDHVWVDGAGDVHATINGTTHDIG